MDTKQLIRYLKELKIEYTYIEHPPVYTCEEADLYTSHFQGVGTKTLFITNKDTTEHCLLMTQSDSRINFKYLSRTLHQKRLKFVSPDITQRLLGVEAGAVSIFGALNNKNITVVLDERLFENELAQVHPLINTATLIISMTSIIKILNYEDIDYRRLVIPIM